MNSDGVTPLYVAALNGHEKIVDLLLNKRYNCNTNIQELKYGQTPLHMATLVIWEKHKN